MAVTASARGSEHCRADASSALNASSEPPFTGRAPRRRATSLLCEKPHRCLLPPLEVRADPMSSHRDTLEQRTYSPDFLGETPLRRKWQLPPTWSDWGNTPDHRNHWSSRGFRRFVSTRFDVVQLLAPPPWTVVLGVMR